MRVAALNLGSSSLKTAVYDVRAPALKAVSVASYGADAVDEALDAMAASEPQAIGHRIVFGGPDCDEPLRAEDALLDKLDGYGLLEPLHLPAQLRLCRAARERFPLAVHVLCFDTAFHRSAPSIAHALPLPANIDPLLMRYGYHGLSYEYIATRLPPRERTIVAHLGSGASLCAMRDRKPIDTTMGFSAFGGLMMGTRPGDLDPGVLLYLIDRGYNAGALRELCAKHSGLLGVSGRSADMRTLLELRASDERANLAIELFTYQLIKMIGAMAAVLGGVDRLVFTGGIGEHAAPIREAVGGAIGFLGKVTVEVIATDENLMIARHALRTAAVR